MREGLRTGLLIAAVLCFVAFLTYQAEGSQAAGVETRRHTVGLPFSPWFVKTVENGPDSRSETTRITLASWSWAVLAVGALLLGVRNALGETPSNPATPAGAGGVS